MRHAQLDGAAKAGGAEPSLCPEALRVVVPFFMTCLLLRGYSRLSIKGIHSSLWVEGLQGRVEKLRRCHVPLLLVGFCHFCFGGLSR